MASTSVVDSYNSQPPNNAIDVEVVHALRRAVKDCSDRGLSVASKWASELLISISPKTRHEATHSESANYAHGRDYPLHARVDDPNAIHAEGDAKTLSSPSSTSLVTTSYITKDISPRASTLVNANIAGLGAGYKGQPSPAPELQPSSSGEQQYYGQQYPYGMDNTQAQRAAVEDAVLELGDEDALMAARSFYAGKEFERAAYALRGRRSTKARFLRMYCQFLASEKTALRDWHKLDHNRGQPPAPVNNTVLEMLNALDNETDPWLLFLRALFLSRTHRRSEALESVLLSIGGYPWNWSAWTLLCSMISDLNELTALLPLLPLAPTHPLVQLFQIKAATDMQGGTSVEIGMCDRLLAEGAFAESSWIMGMRALILYYDHEFGQAEDQFNRILELDPHRIDDIDVFSNILYVTQNRSRLSKLAHDMLALDKDRPEVCCLVGNHYSLRADHEKAVRYFRRATQLDPTFLAAWTLMGHEYVEMKNPHAAIESYRRAVDVNRKDYRAWYGLGQAYELLSMHQYALHYFHRATALRPYDVRLWQAQGGCYEVLSRPREAIESYKRALLGADPHETTINLKLAKLHADIEEYAEAAAYHRRVVEVCRVMGRSIPDYAKSAMWVARYHMSLGGGDLGLAREYLETVASSNAEEVGQAIEALRKLRAIMAAGGSSTSGTGSERDREKAGSSSRFGGGGGTGSDASVPRGKRDTVASELPFPSWVTSDKSEESTTTSTSNRTEKTEKTGREPRRTGRSTPGGASTVGAGTFGQIGRAPSGSGGGGPGSMDGSWVGTQEPQFEEGSEG